MMRTAVILFALMAVCGAPQRSSAQPVSATAPPAQTEPIERVTVDFAARTFDRVLPFDVPFLIVGAAPEGAVSLDVQYAIIPKSGSPATPDVWLPSTAASWNPETPATANQSFVVFLRDSLDAERYYRFRFVFLRQPTTEQIGKFRAAARPGFDERLRLLDPANIPLDAVKAIRQDLADIVRSVAESPSWEPTKGSLFDTTDNSAQALVRVLQEVAPDLGAQADRAEILRGFVDSRLRLRQSLQLIQAATALQVLAEAASRLGDGGVAELLKVDAEGLALPRGGAMQMDLVAAGGVMGDVADVWQPEGAAARSRNFQQTARQLEQLAHFVHAVSDANGPARSLIEPVVGAGVISQVAALAAPTGPVSAALEQSRRLSFDMTRLERLLTQREQGLTRLTDLIALVLRDQRFVVGTTVADGGTTQKSYVSADAGLLYAGDIGTAALFIGSNIYFRPVNKNAPLSQKGSFSRRFAITIGMTVSSIADENSRTRSDLFANQSLVVGAGLRVTQSIRAGAGALVFKEANPNPLITKKQAAATWYASFTFDVDVAKGLGGLGGQFK
jgi:hypothetical protein